MFTFIMQCSSGLTYRKIGPTFEFLHNFLSQLLVPSAGGNFRKPCKTGSNLAITVFRF